MHCGEKYKACKLCPIQSPESGELNYVAYIKTLHQEASNSNLCPKPSIESRKIIEHNKRFSHDTSVNPLGTQADILVGY